MKRFQKFVAKQDQQSFLNKYCGLCESLVLQNISFDSFWEQAIPVLIHGGCDTHEELLESFCRLNESNPFYRQSTNARPADPRPQSDTPYFRSGEDVPLAPPRQQNIPTLQMAKPEIRTLTQDQREKFAQMDDPNAPYAQMAKPAVRTAPPGRLARSPEERQKLAQAVKQVQQQFLKAMRGFLQTFDGNRDYLGHQAAKTFYTSLMNSMPAFVEKFTRNMTNSDLGQDSDGHDDATPYLQPADPNETPYLQPAGAPMSQTATPVQKNPNPPKAKPAWAGWNTH